MHRDVILYNPVNPRIAELVETYGGREAAIAEILSELQKS